MKIKTMQVVVLYVFEDVLSEYYAKFSKNKMVDQIWRPSFHQISFLRIISMKVVILNVFEDTQSKYHIRFEKKQSGESNMAAIIPPNTFFEDQSHVVSHFICFITFLRNVFTEKTFLGNDRHIGFPIRFFEKLIIYSA